MSSAIEATRNGEVWGVVHFGKNFTDEIIVRQSDGSASSNETVIGSRIGVTMDFSSELQLSILSGCL